MKILLCSLNSTIVNTCIWYICFKR
jgi:hypothetical protein